MGIKAGIVGMPNVGKSTLFNALTRAQIAAENYPFCTIDPNVGIVPVPDRAARRSSPASSSPRRSCLPRWSSSTSRAWSPVPRRARAWATSFSRISARPTRSRTWCAASRIRTWCTCPAVSNPIRDIEIIDTELCLADLQSVEKAVDRNAKMAKGGDKDATRKRDLFERMRKHLDQGKPVRSMGLTKEEKADSQELHLLTAKPVMYVANVKEDGFTGNKHLDAVTARAKGERPWWCPYAPPSKPRSRSSRRPIAPISSRTWGSASRD